MALNRRAWYNYTRGAIRLMTNIQFQTHRVTDFVRPLTVENAFRTYCNFGQIHNQIFEETYAQASANWIASANYTTGVEVTPSDDELFIDATDSIASWNVAINLTAVPHSVLLRYHKDTDPQAAVVGFQSDGSFYLVGTRSGHLVISKRDSSGVFSDVLNIAKAYPAVADCEVALRHIRFSDDDSDLWRCISLWMNDALMCTYIEKVDGILSNPIYFGFGTYAGSSATFTDISIPQLTEFAETCTLDPSENPMGGLQRAIEGRYIKMVMRPTGSLRAWRPVQTESVHEFFDGDTLSTDLPFDRRSIFNHVRQVGAYRQAEFVRPDLIKEQGHRFTELNNPFLMTEAECYDQARLSILRMESEADGKTMVSPFTPLVQIEDHITTPDGEYIITGRDISIEQSRLYQNLQTRKYNLVGS